MQHHSHRHHRPKNPRPILGILSLITFVAALCIGVFSTMHIAAHSSEMASFGAIAGIGLGMLASIPSLLLAISGFLRSEKPIWPSALGLLLSAVPGSFGIMMLASALVGRH